MTTYTEPKAVETKSELIESGINGRGERVYTVEVVRKSDGRYISSHRFDTKSEALSWIKWA